MRQVTEQHAATLTTPAAASGGDTDGDSSSNNIPKRDLSSDEACARIVQAKGHQFVPISDFYSLQCGVQVHPKRSPARRVRRGAGSGGAGGGVLGAAYTDVPPMTTAALRHKRPKGSSVYIDTTACRYNVVRQAAAKLGWAEAGPDTPAPSVVWVDTSISEARIARLPEGSRVNHFPGMLLLCRKVDSARLLAKMKRGHPSSYKFIPATYFNHEEYLRSRRGPQADKWFIVKPDSGCMGKGIRLTNAPKADMFENAVVQSYVREPLLIDQCKWDMRVYVLILSVDPLRVYVYRDGFIRLCTEKYQAPTEANAENTLIHLTNYAIHKKSKKYTGNNVASDGEDGAPAEETGCKRSFAFLTNHIRRLGRDPDAFWESVSDLCVKSVLAVKDNLKYAYKAAFSNPMNRGTSCFELLGFDVLVDKDLQPWLLEVNHAPSFTCDTQLDYDIKSGLVEEALTLLGVELEAEECARHAVLQGRSAAVPSPSAAGGGCSPAAGSGGLGGGGGATASAAAAAAAAADGPGPAALRRGMRAAFHRRKEHYEETSCRRFALAYPTTNPERRAEYTGVCLGSTLFCGTFTRMFHHLPHTAR